MKTNRQQMIATFIKEGRMAKGLTQKELSERSNVSVRSIQRIENGELVPRSYTLKTLAEILGLSIESIPQAEQEKKSSKGLNKVQRIILSAGVSLVIILIALAFVAQSPRFPETMFESLLFGVAILAVITIVLVLIWRSRR